MKSFRVMGYCDSKRTKNDGWTPPQKIVTGASEKYAISLVKEWIHNHPQRFDTYCILEEANAPGCKRAVTRVKYVAQRVFNLKNTKNWQLLELKEDINEETPAPPLTAEELEAIEELKADGTLYGGSDVEPW